MKQPNKQTKVQVQHQSQSIQFFLQTESSFFYQKFDQKASNICVVFSLCTLQVAHDYQHTEATTDNFCQAARGEGEYLRPICLGRS
jgi:hypothetical protein